MFVHDYRGVSFEAAAAALDGEIRKLGQPQRRGCR